MSLIITHWDKPAPRANPPPLPPIILIPTNTRPVASLLPHFQQHRSLQPSLNLTSPILAPHKTLKESLRTDYYLKR